jgi:hypothetical protein
MNDGNYHFSTINVLIFVSCLSEHTIDLKFGFTKRATNPLASTTNTTHGVIPSYASSTSNETHLSHYASLSYEYIALSIHMIFLANDHSKTPERLYSTPHNDSHKKQKIYIDEQIIATSQQAKRHFYSNNNQDMTLSVSPCHNMWDASKHTADLVEVRSDMKPSLIEGTSHLKNTHPIAISPYNLVSQNTQDRYEDAKTEAIRTKVLDYLQVDDTKLPSEEALIHYRRGR